jgi:hypothetical protein
MMEMPEDFGDIIGDLMVEYGPDRHRDGCDKIAEEAWKWLFQRFNITDVVNPPVENGGKG